MNFNDLIHKTYMIKLKNTFFLTVEKYLFLTPGDA